MQPKGPSFGGGATGTVLSPVVLVAMLVAMVLFFALPRKYVIAPVLLSAFLIPEGQQIFAAGVHLFILRLLFLAAYVRVMISKVPGSKSRLAGNWNPVDSAFVCYVVISAAAAIALSPEVGAFIYQVGYLWDFLLAYLVMRSLIQDEQDTFLAIKCLALLMVVLSADMIYEQMKMVNIFGMLGGVRDIPEVREGKIRSQAVFQHSLTAGTFAATAIPLFILLWKQGKSKMYAAIGIVGATIMTVTTQTSTSLLTYAAGLFAVFLWPLRKKMKSIRTGLVVVLVGLHLVMKAPVWFLIARIDLTGSSSSYHRAELIDQFINHFSSWWLIGTKDAGTWGWDMWDAQDMFVSVGEAGGLAALAYYILVISRSFSRLGNSRKAVRNNNQEWFAWFLGSAIFANVVAFFGVNYFDQSRVTWFLLLAMTSAFTSKLLNHDPTRVTVNVQVVDTTHVEELEIEQVAQTPLWKHLFD